MKTKTWMIPLTISIFFFTISNMASATWIKADFFSAHDDDMSYDSVLKPGGDRKDYSPLAGNIAGQARDEIDHWGWPLARNKHTAPDLIPFEIWSGYDKGGIGGQPFENDLFFDKGSLTSPAPPASVPEPATMLLLGAGLIAIAGLRKKIRE